MRKMPSSSMRVLSVSPAGGIFECLGSLELSGGAQSNSVLWDGGGGLLKHILNVCLSLLLFLPDL